MSRTLEPESLTTTLAPRWRAYPAYKPSGVDWLGEIPAHWEARRLKYVARFAYGDALASEVREDGEIAVYGSNGIVGSHTSANTKAPCLIVGRKGSYGKVTYSEEPCFAIDTTFFIDQTQTSQYMRWLYYMLLCLRLDDVSKDSAIPGLAREDAYAYFVALPPLPEQRAIAAFLDRETAKLDALITKKEELIALLQEKRAAIISHTVTRGLDPAAPLKDSGVEWIGQIPAHWEVKKIKRLCLVKRGASPRPIDDPIYFDDEGEYAWVRISDVTASSKYLLTTEQKLSAIGQSKSVPLEPGEMFLSIAGSVGKPIISAIKCCIHDGFVYFVGLKQNREYLFYLFSGGELYKGLGKLGTQLNLNTDTIGDIKIPIPPLPEQQEIAVHLDQQTAKIDALISTIRQAIEKVQEERTALIAAAVTGKIDAREEGA